MFSDNYNSFNHEIKQILRDIKLPSDEEVKDILIRSVYSKLSFEDVAKLLEIGNHPKKGLSAFNFVRKHIHKRFRKEKNNELRHMSPIYISSFCENECKYCNFSANMDGVQRIRLTLSQLDEELNVVLSEGNKVVEFTLASDPLINVNVLADYIFHTKKRLNDISGSGIFLAAKYLSIKEYVFLKNAGLFGMVQWDETLDKQQYENWHGTVFRKSKFDLRIDNHDRAIQAGLQVATGCLFGLSDYRYDVLMQLAKVRYIEKTYGVRPFVFGTARLKAIHGLSIKSEYEVTDMQYELALMVYKIVEPKIARWLQTRESMDLNLRNIVDGDVYTYRCGDVMPGGYKVNVKQINTCGGGQFSVDETTKEELGVKLKKLNFNVNYAWIK